MADTTTGLPIKTLSGEFVGSKIIDSGGTNVASVSAGGALKVDASSVAVPITDNAGSLTVDAPVGTPVFVSLSDGAAALKGQKTMANSVPVTIASDQTGFSNTQYVGDAAATATPTGTIEMALANAAAPTNVSADNDAVALWALRNGSLVVNLASSGTLITVGSKVSASSIPVVIASDQGAVAVSGTVTATLATTYVGDAAATATPSGGMIMGLANAAAPSDVSANNDAVAMWLLRNGSPVVNLASGGTLITLGSKVSASSIPVVIASDQGTFAVTVSGVATAANQTNHQVVDNAAFTDGTTTLVMGGYIFDDVAGTALTENDAAAARINANRAQVFVGEDATTRGQRWSVSAAGALAANITQIGGATQSATAPLFVRLTDGTTAYSAGSAAPTLPKFSTKTSSALGAGASVDLTHYVTSGKTGQLAGVDFGATVPLKVIINTEVTASKTTRVVLFTQPNTTYQWRSPFKTYITQASADATSGFSVTIKNLDAAVAADVYSTGFWDEV